MSRILMLKGAGTGADASGVNGGIYESTTAWSAAQGANGGPLAATTACTTSADGGNIKVTKTGSLVLNDGLADVWAYVNFASDYASDWYKVLSHGSAGGNSWVVIDEPHTGPNPAVNIINVGGAWGTDYTSIARMGFIESGDTFKLVEDQTYVITAGLVISSGGAVNAPVWIEAVDNTGARIAWDSTTKPVIQGMGAFSVLLSPGVGHDYIKTWAIEFDAASTVDHCISNLDTTSDYHSWYHCEMHHSVSYVIEHANTGGLFYNCEIHHGGQSAAANQHAVFSSSGDNASYIYCTFHDNAANASNYDLSMSGNNLLVEDCLFYNGGDGGGARFWSHYATCRNNSFYDHGHSAIR